MSFVGGGKGAYTTETTYKYVGRGAGEFSYVTPKTSFAWAVGLGLAALLVIVLLIIIFLPGTTTTTEPTTGPPKSCLIWGDPHIDTFDHAFPNFYMVGEFWIVKSKMVSVQGRYLATPFTNGLAATHAIAVGGHFLLGHTVVVGPMQNGLILVDGQPVCGGFPSTYSVEGVGTISYNAQGDVVDGAQSHLQKHIVHMDLPLGVHIEVMRWANHINVRLTMAPRVGGQDGHCGNFNGNPDDDSAAAITARVGGQIPENEMLFHHMTPAAPSPHHDLNECKRDKVKYAKAKQICRAKGGGEMKGCIFDACFAGTAYAEQDVADER